MTKFFNYYNSLCVGVNTPNVFTFDPYFNAVKEFFMIEIKQIIYYMEKLKELSVDTSKYRDKVIDFISIIITNLDFSRENFFLIVEDLYQNKIKIKNEYIEISKSKNIEYTLLNEKETDLSTEEKIIKLLNEYEQNSNKKKEIPQNIKSLFAIATSLILNACNSLSELKEYNYNFTEAKDEILKLFNTSTYDLENEEEIKNKIIEFAKCNYKITKKLNEKIIEKYGKIKRKTVDYKTKKGKCILVSGNNLNDLEKILQATKNTNINVYTHDAMINAFKYESFEKYENLIGHYQNSENLFSIDFATFPGAIYISKNSLPQIDIIRGQIYTSAKNPAFGIGKIINDDFTDLIKYSEKQKGFLLDKTLKAITIGYTKEILKKEVETLKEKIKNNEIKNIYLFGHLNKTIQKTENIKQEINKLSKEDYIISFGYNTERKNVWNANPFYDFEMLYDLIETLKKEIKNIEEKIKITITDCNNETISTIFNLKSLGIKEIYLGECCPNIINPTIINGLKQMFNIKELKD